METALVSATEEQFYPIPEHSLERKLGLFAQFDESELSEVTSNRLHVLPKGNPLRTLIVPGVRPELSFRGVTSFAERTQVERRRGAYRLGTVVGGALVVRRAVDLGLDVKTITDNQDSSVVMGAVFDAAYAGRRFPVTQYFDTDTDVQDMLVTLAEEPWIRQQVHLFHGHEHEPGHIDYFQVGLGDALAEHFTRTTGQQSQTISLV